MESGQIVTNPTGYPVERAVIAAAAVTLALITVRTVYAARIELSQFVFEELSLLLNRHKRVREGDDADWVTKHYGWVEGPNWHIVHLGTTRVPRR